MSGWFAADAGTWEVVVEQMQAHGPLSEEMAGLDLRHFENLVRAGARPFPSRRELQKRWGWTEREVRTVLCRDDWHDPNHPVSREELLDRKGGRFSVTKRPGEGPGDRPANVPVTVPVENGPTYTIDVSTSSQCPGDRPGEGPGDRPHARSILEPENQGTRNQLERTRADSLPAQARPRTLVSSIWEAIQRLYVDSGHGNVALDLDSSGRRQALDACLRKLHRDPLVAARALIKVLAFWLYGPNDWYREHLHGSELIAALLRPTKIGENHTKAESWDWDGEVHERAGPTTGARKESNFARQLRELEREWEEPSGISAGDLEGPEASPSLRLLQQPPRG
jgi:hypothetical protein